MTHFTQNTRNFLSAHLKKKYFIHFTVIFLIALCFNIDNKTIIAASFVYLIASVYILKSVSKGLIFSFLLFSLFSVGKTFEFILIPLSNLEYGHWISGYQGYETFVILGPAFFIGLIMIIWFIVSIIKGTIKFDKYSKVFLLYFLLSLISAVVSINFGLSIIYWFLGLPLLPLFCFLKRELTMDKNFIYDLLKLFSVFVIYETLFAFFQYIAQSSLLPSLVFIHNIAIEGTDLSQSWFRPWGTFNHPNDLANFLLPLILIFFLYGYIKLIKEKNYLIMGFIFGLCGILITLSRSSWVALFLTVLVSTVLFEKKYRLNFDRKYMKILIATTLLFLPLIVLFAVPRLQRSSLTFTEGGSGLFRINQLKESMALIMKYPLFGVGQGMSVLGMYLENPLGEMYYFPTSTHNMYLNFAEEIGLIPFLLFFFFLAILFSSRMPTTVNNLFSHKIPGLIFFSATISILLNGLVQPIYSSTMLYLLVFATIYNTYAKLS